MGNREPPYTTMVNTFNGQYSDIDPDDCPQGTMLKQHNMLSVVQGQLTSRGGLKEIELDILE